VVLPETIATNGTDSSSSSRSSLLLSSSSLFGRATENENVNDDNDYPFRFKIRHVKKSIHSHLPSLPEKSTTTTSTCYQQDRILSCPSKAECDNWVLSINQALLRYEKDMAESRQRRTIQLNNSIALRQRISELSWRTTLPKDGRSKKNKNKTSSSKKSLSSQHHSSNSSTQQLMQQQQQQPLPRYPSSKPPNVVVIAL
jgi:hypothetical protein